MRRLASELGVGTMTLYGYFRNKDELLDAIVDHAAEDLELPPADAPWREGVAAIAREIRGVLERHPSGLRIRLTRPMLSPGALRSAERAYELLARAGFSAALAARCYRTIFLYAFAFASFTQSESMEEVRRRSVAAALSLPPDEYPRLHAAAAEVAAAMAGDEQFEFGLALILDGIEEARAREDEPSA